jgi:lysophospholipase L1-like esterase
VIRILRTLFLSTLLLAPSLAQDSALLPNRDALALYDRVVQLMDASTAVVPGLARAGAPVIENARQSIVTLRAGNIQDTTLNYEFLTNVRAFLALFDALPKPHPYPEAARKQSLELRESADRVEVHFRALLTARETQVRNPDRDNLKRYAEANSRLGSPDREDPRVVFLGDSITDGWRLNEYFPDRDFVNRGIGGQITGQMLARFQADVVNLKPVAVHLLAGTNDIARGVPLDDIQNNFRMIGALADQHKIKVVIGSVLPVHNYNKDENPGWEQTFRRPLQTIIDLNVWLQRLCADRGYTYINYYGHMLDTNNFLRQDLAEDGLHPNGDGYRIMASQVLPVIDKLARATPPEKRRRRILF